MKILSICGSPRKGNSETVIFYIQKLLQEKGIENEVILLREKNIHHCTGCVEYCNRKFACHYQDDMPEIMQKMEEADGFVFVSPNYFKMPPGLFKNFMDRCSVFITACKEADFAKKKAIVVCIGADEPSETDTCTNNVADNFCTTLGMKVVGRKSFRSRSELEGNFNYILENKHYTKIKDDLKGLVDALVS